MLETSNNILKSTCLTASCFSNYKASSRISEYMAEYKDPKKRVRPVTTYKEFPDVQDSYENQPVGGRVQERYRQFIKRKLAEEKKVKKEESSHEIYYLDPYQHRSHPESMYHIAKSYYKSNLPHCNIASCNYPYLKTFNSTNQSENENCATKQVNFTNNSHYYPCKTNHTLNRHSNTHLCKNSLNYKINSPTCHKR
ncbi:DgyrCDS287 [Dimorphilus gyrociliatus]|uniref:DgyrCDS287 n=1 Tax=Dimorphilus gyrociliatus TaxID=2664684 RepID=A0A7I8V6P0_9ANNE|nr:DgyrCDS287 [Dimorphilus gyrociliatus]